MTWISETGKEYNLCLIDTNIISEISKNKLGERNKFFKHFLANSWAICITSGMLFELRKNTQVYKQFLEVFSIFPFFILKPFINLFEEEKKVYETKEKLIPIQIPISFANKNQKLHLKRFMQELFSRKEVIETEKMRRIDETQVLNNWLSRINNYNPESEEANSKDANRYVKEALIQTIIKLDIDIGSNFIRKKIEKKEEIEFEKFQLVMIMLYSQYYRLYDSGWKSAPQEVTDIEIMAAVPYMEVVITENFQAEILKKVRNGFSPISELEILTLRDIRGWTL